MGVWVIVRLWRFVLGFDCFILLLGVFAVYLCCVCCSLVYWFLVVGLVVGCLWLVISGLGLLDLVVLFGGFGLFMFGFAVLLC